MNNTLWLATHNQGKVREFQTLLKEIPFQLKLMDSKKSPEETGETFEENALIKLKAFQKLKPQSWILAEDSGIEVQALDGRPGVRSARYQGEKATWVHRLQCLLEEMKNVSQEKRQARMVSFSAAVTPTGEILKSRGVIKGCISEDMRGTQGFAYDFVFIPEGEVKTLAELGMAYKNKYSHRTNSIQKLKKMIHPFLQKQDL